MIEFANHSSTPPDLDAPSPATTSEATCIAIRVNALRWRSTSQHRSRVLFFCIILPLTAMLKVQPQASKPSSGEGEFVAHTIAH
jgi:hypothetical protein